MYAAKDLKYMPNLFDVHVTVKVRNQYDSNLKSVAYAQKNTHFDRYPISRKINW